MPRAYKNARLEGWRINLFIVLIVLATAGIFLHLLDLTYFKHADFVRSSQFQYNNPAAIISGRGDIYVSDHSDNSKHIVATNRAFWYVYTNNKQIESVDNAASAVAPIIGKSKEEITAQLTSKNS